MNQKIEITKYVLEILGKDSSLENIRKMIPVWWFSTRKKSNGGLRLTQTGFDALKQAGIKDYRIKYENEFIFSNQLLIRIDQFIDCPFFLNHKEIYVFSEKMAVQLVLFSGNIYQFSSAKAQKISN